MPHFVEQISSPAYNFTRPTFSLARLQHKYRAIQRCKKVWGYRREDDINRDIIRSYLALVEAIGQNDRSMILRHTSVSLFEQY